MNPKAFRLSAAVRPLHYDARIDVRPGAAAFRGRVRISLDVREPVREITLHARDLDVEEAKLEAPGGDLKLAWTLDPASETLRLAAPATIPAGAATLDLAYAGPVSRGLHGLYLARDGPESCLVTQCQETHARAVLPCFDEPSFKARVSWRVTTSKDVTVVANGPLLETRDEPDGASRTWVFDATPPISPYLYALAIGNFASTPQTRAGSAALRVWAMAGKEHLGAFAQRITERLVPWYEEYFGHPYPYRKYDQLAVPGFAAGAMENVGLATFRQLYLLLDPATASLRQEQNVAHVVAHELAHMWFGNLVTMRWWDEIWLNESFADWIANKAIDDLEPSYRIWDAQHAERAAAFGLDALDGTHPIHQPVETPEEAAEMFDAITYNKGAATMRMLEAYLGAEAFRDGIRTYMREFKEDNATGTDLWRHLRSASGAPVERIMGEWIRRPGHPVVSLSIEGGPTAPRARLRQRRFLLRAGAPPVEPPWPVPVVLRLRDAEGVREIRHILDSEEAVVPLPARGPVRWCLGNAGGLGFFRTDPDDAALEALLAHAADLSAAERCSLLDDELGLARNATRPFARYLRVVEALAPARDSVVLEKALEALRGIEDMLAQAQDDAACAGFARFVREAFGPLLAEVGIDPAPGEPRDTAQRRALLLEIVASLGNDPGAIALAQRVVDREAGDAKGVEGGLAERALAVVAKRGDEKRLAAFVEVYTKRRASGASPQETSRYLGALPAFEAPGLPERILRLHDENVLPLEAVAPLLRTMLGRRHAQLAAWDHLRGNWATLRKSLGDMWMTFLIEHSGNLPASRRAEMIAFYDANLDGLGERSFRRAIEALDARAEFRARTREDLVAWGRSRA